jgi:hypothetical protein
MVAEAAVLIAVRVLALVLLPEQVERHAFPAQFPMHAGPVGFRSLRLRGRRRRVEQRFDRGFRHAGRQRIGQSGQLRPTENLALPSSARR